MYASPALRALDRSALKDDVERSAPVLPAMEFRPDLPSSAGATARADGVRRSLFAFASARIADTRVPGEFLAPGGQDLDIELMLDAVPEQVPMALVVARLYDGERLAQDAMALLPEGERGLDTLHLWVTRRLLLTYSPDDYRYHARFALFAYPAVFSVAGLAHAPAPSLEAALFSRALSAKGFPADAIARELDREYPEERIDLDDARTVTRAAGSVLLQASARVATGDPFCDEPACRLFNPHRRAELLRSLVGGRMCARHARLFAKPKVAATRRAR